MNKINKGQLVKSNLSKEEMSKAFSLALTNKNLITEDDTAIIFYNFTFFEK